MIYFIQAGDTGPIKIGYADDPIRRLRSIQTGSWMPLFVLGSIPGGYFTERWVHKKFRHLHLRGEWYRASAELVRFVQGVLTGTISLPADLGCEAMVADIHLLVHPGLRQLVEEKADLEGLALNEWVAKTLAQMLGKPEFGVVPRKRMGRPRKPRTFQAM